jgi:phage-related holin
MDRLNNIATGKILTAGIFSFLGMFTSISILLIGVAVFILTDFTLGLIVSYKVKKQGFVTQRAYHTVWKFVGAEIVVIMSHLLDTIVIPLVNIRLAIIMAGIICCLELWSILSNFAILSNHRIFKIIQKFAKHEIENKVSSLKDFDKEIDNEKT